MPDSAETGTRVRIADVGKTISLVLATGWGLPVTTVVLAVVQALAPAATLWAGKALMNAVAAVIYGAPAHLYDLGILVGLQLAILTAGALLASASSSIRDVLAQRVQETTTERLLTRAAAIDLATFESPSTHDALRLAYREAGGRPLTLVHQLLGLIQSTVTITSVSALMAQLGWSVLSLVVLATLPGLIVTHRFSTVAHQVWRDRTPFERMQAYLASLLASAASAKEIRTLETGRFLLDKWRTLSRDTRARFVRLHEQRAVWSAVSSLASSVLIGIAMLTVIRQVTRGTVTIGDFWLLLVGVTQLQTHLGLFVSSGAGVYDSLLYMRNVFRFMELTHTENTRRPAWSERIEKIEFDNVTFRYPTSTTSVLHNVSFAVEAGSFLALAGANGAGKTTLIKLLAQLYQPTQGRILLNGRDAREFDPATVRRHMSILFQDFGRYSMTARENIELGDLQRVPGMTDIDSAATRAAAAQLIRALPKQYETLLGLTFDGGHELSQGQWQRLALARAYVRRASVYIFDEPTASLDAEAQIAFVRELRQAEGATITIVISHHVPVIMRADLILVLRDGTIQESGTHADLMERGGTYAMLASLYTSDSA